MMRHKSLLLSLALLPALAHAELYISIVEGLSGTAEYQEEFDGMREKISAASATIADADKVTVFSGEEATQENLLAHFTALSTRMTANDRAIIYLIGHGSFDGAQYKFNIPGPDLTGEQFKEVLDKLPGKNHFLVNTTSTSGAMLETILGKEEASANILVAATRNGNERNATHFGRFFAEALTSEEADLNKNSNISIQEAYDFADRNVTAYFEDSGRLATEHPQLRGEGAAQFSLSRVNELKIANDDPLLSQLLQQRLDIDTRIEDLQLRRNEFSNADYIARLQALVLQAAQVSEKIEAAQAGAGGASD